MRSFVLAALPFFLVAACSRPAAPEPAGPDAGEAARLAAVERLMGLETCEDAAANYGGQVSQLTTCRLELGEGKPRFVVSSDMMIESDTESLGTVRAELNGEAGTSLQVIEEQASGAFSYPYAEDLDGDGAADLMVPLVTGNVNTTYALWVQQPDGLFVRAGELSGVSISRTPEGWIAASGRSSAVEWETHFFRYADGALQEVAAVVNRPEPEEGERPLPGPACVVIRVLDGIDPEPFCTAAAKAPG